MAALENGGRERLLCYASAVPERGHEAGENQPRECRDERQGEDDVAGGADKPGGENRRNDGGAEMRGQDDAACRAGACGRYFFLRERDHE